MKLATLNNRTRDGRLVVVSKDLHWYSEVGHIAHTLQEALDDWAHIEHRLREVADGLETGSQPKARFHEREALSPLPRAYQWLDGSAYVNHVALVRKARGAEMPESFWTDPLMYQGGSDGFLAPRAPIKVEDTGFGVDMEAEVCVIVNDVPQNPSLEVAGAAICLIMLCNDVSLRNLIPAELAKGFGFVQSKPASSFSPVCVTPDGLGSLWRDHKISGALQVDLNGKPFGRADASVDMTFDFAKLVQHAAKTRALSAGTIIGSGTVSNNLGTKHGQAIEKGGVGYSCIAERRMVETIETGAAITPFMAYGDIVRIEMLDKDGHSLFGAIEQSIEPLDATA